MLMLNVDFGECRYEGIGVCLGVCLRVCVCVCVYVYVFVYNFQYIKYAIRFINVKYKQYHIKIHI